MLAVPSALIDFLSGPQGMPGFRREPHHYQMILATMLWVSADWQRRHRRHRNAFSFTTGEIVEWFGSVARFREINRYPWARYYRVHRHANGRSGKQNYTNGYEPHPVWQAAFQRYLRSASTPSFLIGKSGRRIKTAPKPVASLDVNGNHALGWKGVSVPTRVPVNIHNLWVVERDWEALVTAIEQGEVLTHDDFPGIQSAKQIVIAAQALRHATDNVDFPGHVLHQYRQVGSGRLFAGGINLQNCPRLVRKAALSGFFDYDIANCHFAILHQLAGRYGSQLEAVGYYLNNKRSVRTALASEVGITVEQAKIALTATIYGARASTWEDAAIAKAVGRDPASKLFRNETYRAIKDDLQAAKKVVLDSHPQNGGRYINLIGKASPAGSTADQIMSHLLQGVEVVALRAAIGTCPGKVLLLQHDGFTASARVDVPAMEEAV